jgi:hypothetical protein
MFKHCLDVVSTPVSWERIKVQGDCTSRVQQREIQWTIGNHIDLHFEHTFWVYALNVDFAKQ